MKRFSTRCLVIALSGCLTVPAVCPIAARAADTLKIEVRETAGIKRFGYPVAVKLPDLVVEAANPRFRLRDGTRPVPAQFRHEPTDDGPGAWWLDFALDMVPDERRTLTLEYGPDVVADREPSGLELKPTPDGFEIRNFTHLTWTAGRNVLELVKSVDAAELHYLRRGGLRLAIEGPTGTVDARDEETAPPRVIRSGPLAVAIRYEWAPKAGPLAEMKSTVELTFPVSKSWVQVDWRIDDQRHAVRSVRADIAQNLAEPSDDEPTLVDFGASSLVYMSLAPGTRGRLQATAASAESSASPRQAWEVFRGVEDRLEPFVVRSAGPSGGDAEGWAHIMDRSRCLALAIDEFGDAGADSIDITAEGKVTFMRKFATGETNQASAKNFRFWLHFVGFPPHVTAATSPQSMLSPLTVRITKP